MIERIAILGTPRPFASELAALLRHQAGFEVVAPAVDPFSLADLEAALRGVRRLVYLPGAPTASAQLVQARTEDLDLLCADNVGRAAAAAAVEHIVYTPDSAEVAQALGAHGVATTELGRDPASWLEDARHALGVERVVGLASEPLPCPLAPTPRSVRSVQRLPLPRRVDARWVAEEYLRWLPRGPLRVHVEPEPLVAQLRLFGITLLELALDSEHGSAEVQQFSIRGGLLAAVPRHGRFEFRILPAHPALLTAIHDFTPSLPWPIYRSTQAPLHALVMWAFGRHLERAS